MFDAIATNRRERIQFIQFGERENNLISWATAIVLVAMFVVGVMA